MNDALKNWNFDDGVSPLKNFSTWEELINPIPFETQLTLPKGLEKKLTNYFKMFYQGRKFNQNNYGDIMGIVLEFSRRLNLPLLLMDCLRAYSSDEKHWNKISLGQHSCVPVCSCVTDMEEKLFEYIEQLSLTNLSNEDAGLIAFWRVMLGLGELPPKEIMYDFFQEMPNSLQILFFKAIFSNLHHWEPRSRKDIIATAEYINEFHFTDLSCQALLLLIRSRKTHGITDQIKNELKTILMESLTDVEKVPHIGHFIKACNGRKYRSGEIWYDTEKKTYSFSGGFGLEISEENSPDRFMVSREEGEDLPF